MRGYGRDYRGYDGSQRRYYGREYGWEYRGNHPNQGYDRNFGYYHNRGGWNRNYVPHGYDIDYAYTRGDIGGSRDMSGGYWNVSGAPAGDLAQGGSAFGGGSGSSSAWGASGGPYDAYGSSEMGISFPSRRTPRQGYVGGRGLYDRVGSGLGHVRSRYGGPTA
jgi:hypothetical protein